MVYVIEVYFQESIVYHKYEKALKNSKIWNDYILAVDESDRNIIVRE